MLDTAPVRFLPWFLAGCSTAVLAAQRGDVAGESQPALPDTLVVPPAPARSAEAELGTLQVVAGCRVELFASEPLVADPVAAAFDADGRLWVVEMRGYMHDLDATGEAEPTGRIVVLHDDDGDGRADRSTAFAEQLVLPRAVLPLRGGALVVTPPELLWMPDADGDLVADGRASVMGGFEAGLENPEHSGNGLLWGFDHRIHLANDKRLVRRIGDRFQVEAGAGGGQWGISSDDRGRLYCNYNSDWLHCDLVPGRYAVAASAVGGLPLVNARLVRDTSVWPIRVTPGVNRGYRDGMLKDGVLTTHTAACAPLVYRGGWLPFDGDVFACEPAGNCVRRIVLRDLDGAMQGENAYQAERREFLASTDERFRPVSLLNGLDGALYVVDLYRGVIQHRNFVTSFLRRQIEQRGLERPIGLGRVWRVVPTDVAPPPPAPRLGAAEPAQLVRALAHANGAVRDLALRELVQRRPRGVVPELQRWLADDARPAVRIALLSALAGLDALTTTDLRRAVRDPDPGVVAFALQHVGPSLGRGDPLLWGALERLAAVGTPSVRWHVALAVGDALGAPGGPKAGCDERALALLATMVSTTPGDGGLRAAVATAAQAGLGDVLARLCEALAGEGTTDAAAALRDLAARAVRSRQPAAQERVFALAARARATWQVQQLLAGAVAALPKGKQQDGWLVFPATPAPLAALAQHGDATVRQHALTLLAAVRLEGTPVPGAVTSLTPDEQRRVRDGELVFRRACAACHQLDGRGQRGLAPPLQDSEWVLGPPEQLARIALHGVKGPIEVDGETWSLEMPGQGHLSDAELAQVLSYLRRAFGHQASCIEAALVAAERQATAGRGDAWTAAELLGSR